MPRIGCGLAGGKWEEIEPIIDMDHIIFVPCTSFKQSSCLKEIVDEIEFVLFFGKSVFKFIIRKVEIDGFSYKIKAIHHYFYFFSFHVCVNMKLLDNCKSLSTSIKLDPSTAPFAVIIL